MAYDKIIPVRGRLDHCMGYVLNPEKTDLARVLNYIGNDEKTGIPDTVLKTAINCQVETAYRDMRETKRRWNKYGGVLGYHLIHSYAPGEVTPQEAHAAGVEFARRLLGERYEAVVATHVDREHLHCHILFNSVSFVDGKKYQNTFKDYYGDIRGISNAVSADYGQSVIRSEGKGKHYAEWDAEQCGKATIRSLVRQDIDAAIGDAFTYQSFWALLEKRGYTVKRGTNVKHTAVKPPGSQRFVRLDSLGADYTEDAIKARLAEVRSGATRKAETPAPTQMPTTKRRYTVKSGGKLPRGKKLRGFRALYVHYLYFLKIRRPNGKRNAVPIAVRAEVTKLERYQRQFQLLRTYRIDTDGQLALLADALQSKIDAGTAERKDLYQRKRQGEDVSVELDAINLELRQLRREQTTCQQIGKDIPRIRSQTQVIRGAQQAQEEEQHRKQQKIKERGTFQWR